MWYDAEDDLNDPKVDYYQKYVAYPCSHCVQKRSDGTPCASKPIPSRETTPCPSWSKQDDGYNLAVVGGRPCNCAGEEPPWDGRVAETSQTEISGLGAAFAPEPPSSATESFQVSPNISERATEIVPSISSAGTSYQSLPKKPNVMTCPCPRCTSDRCRQNKSTCSSQTDTDCGKTKTKALKSPKASRTVSQGHGTHTGSGTVSQGHGTHTSSGCSSDEIYEAYGYPYDLVTSQLSERALEERPGSGWGSPTESSRSTHTRDVQSQRSSPDSSIAKKPSSTPRRPRSETRDAYTSPRSVDKHSSDRRSISFDEEDYSDRKDDSKTSEKKKQQSSAVSSTQTRRPKSKRTQKSSAEEYTSVGLDEGYAQANVKRKKKPTREKSPKLKYLYENSASKGKSYPTCPCSSTSVSPPPSRTSKMRAYTSATIGQKMDYLVGLAKPPTCHQSSKSLVLEERCNVLHKLAKVLDPETLSHIRPRHLKCFLSNYDLDALGFHIFCESNGTSVCKGKKRGPKPMQICHCQDEIVGEESPLPPVPLKARKGKNQLEDVEDDDEVSKSSLLEVINENDEPSLVDQHTSAPFMALRDADTSTNPEVFMTERSTSPEERFHRDVQSQTQFNHLKPAIEKKESRSTKSRSAVPSKASREANENKGYDKSKCLCCPNAEYKVSVKSQKCRCGESKGRRSIEARPASAKCCCCSSAQTDYAPVMNVRMCQACCRPKPMPNQVHENARGTTYKDIFTAQQDPATLKCPCAAAPSPSNDGVPRKISASQMDIIDLVEAIRKKLSVDYGRCSCACQM